MTFDGKSLCTAIGNWLGSLGVAVRAAMSTPLESDRPPHGERAVDAEFDAMRHDDPAVMGDAAGRYGHRSPGYLTRNGLGSLEVGAADD